MANLRPIGHRLESAYGSGRVYWDRDWEEYRVSIRPIPDPEQPDIRPAIQTYHTDDLDDAQRTLRTILCLPQE